MAGLAALLTNIQQRKAETVEFPLQVVQIAPDELDPAVWGQNFPGSMILFADAGRHH